jgi:hypothetical protein
VREKGIVCPKCGCIHHYWKKNRSEWECKKCGHRTTLISGTIMHGSKLPFRYLYHGVKPEFLQEYLNEFCYKFNRRYFGEELFERLVMIAASYRTDFEHRTYRKTA